MMKLKILLLISVVIFILLTMLILQFPGHSNHPINQQLKSEVENWGDQVELTQDTLKTGISDDQVQSILNEAGFDIPKTTNLLLKYQPQVQPNKVVYFRKFGNGACNIEYYVFIEYNLNKRLTSATGTAEEAGCL